MFCLKRRPWPNLVEIDDRVPSSNVTVSSPELGSLKMRAASRKALETRVKRRDGVSGTLDIGGADAGGGLKVSPVMETAATSAAAKRRR